MAYKFSNNSTVKTDLIAPIDEIKAHLRIDSDFTDDDGQLIDIFSDVLSEAEAVLGYDLSPTVNTLEIYEFLDSWLKINFMNISELTSIKYLDSDDQEQTVTLGDCKIIKDEYFYFIELPNSIDSSKVTVVFKTGFSNYSDLSGRIKRAIFLRIADYYDIERGGYISGAFKDSGRFEKLLAMDQNRSF